MKKRSGKPTTFDDIVLSKLPVAVDAGQRAQPGALQTDAGAAFGHFQP